MKFGAKEADETIESAFRVIVGALKGGWLLIRRPLRGTHFYKAALEIQDEELLGPQAMAVTAWFCFLSVLLHFGLPFERLLGGIRAVALGKSPSGIILEAAIYAAGIVLFTRLVIRAAELWQGGKIDSDLFLLSFAQCALNGLLGILLLPLLPFSEWLRDLNILTPVLAVYFLFPMFNAIAWPQIGNSLRAQLLKTMLTFSPLLVPYIFWKSLAMLPAGEPIIADFTSCNRAEGDQIYVQAVLHNMSDDLQLVDLHALRIDFIDPPVSERASIVSSS